MYFEVHLVNYLPYRHLIAAQLNAILPISNKGKEAIEKTWNVEDLSTVHVSRLGVKGQENITKTLQLLFANSVRIVKSEAAFKTWEERYKTEKNYMAFVANLLL